ncbi:hypothetical protein D3C71_1615220 [compost metagenome]
MLNSTVWRDVGMSHKKNRGKFDERFFLNPDLYERFPVVLTVHPWGKRDRIWPKIGFGALNCPRDVNNAGPGVPERAM